jgi:T-complex protein 10 C-terminus
MIVYSDGRIQRCAPDGTKVIEYTDGTKEEHRNGEKVKYYASGIVKKVAADGTVETRWPNGQIRIKNSDGLLVHEYMPCF